MATSLASKGLVAVSDKIILAARPEIEAVRLFVTDFTAKAAEKYQNIKVNVLKGSVGDFATGTNNYVTGTNGEVNFAQIGLEKDVISKWSFVDKDFLEDEFDPNWGTLGPSSGRKIAKSFVEHAMGKLDYSKVDTNGQLEVAASVSAATFKDFAAIWAKVNAAGYAPSESVVVLEPTAYLQLKTLADFKTTGIDALNIARALGDVIGFKAVIVAPNCSTVSGAASGGSTPKNGIGFVVPENALGIVNREKRAAKDGGNLLEYGSTTDDETGLVFSTRVVANPDDGEYVWSVECLFGAALMKQTITVGSATRDNGAPGILQLVTA